MPAPQKEKLFLVIMAGGSGTRFWPKSRAHLPKQFLKLGHSNQTLIQQTLGRFNEMLVNKKENRIIVTTQKLKERTMKDLEHLPITILAEPMGKNTAPCIYWAAREVIKNDPQGIMLVMPADHYIPRLSSFQQTLQAAVDWAAQRDDLVTLGVRPTRPETGYGYLKMGETLGESQDQTCKRVSSFVEKPSREKAESFLKEGHYLWNGGMFVWKAEAILKAFDQFLPEMKAAWEKGGGQIEKVYPEMPSISVDFGVMEKAQHVVGFELDCGWDDLGTWTSLESMSEAFQMNQAFGILSQGEVIAVDAKNNIIDVPGKLVGLLGVQNLIIVQDGDVLLVADKSRAQDIKQIVDQVKKSHPEQM